MNIDCNTIRNILVVRNDRFGEFLLNIPALRALKETFTQSKLFVVVDPYVRQLAECVPLIDLIIDWDRGRHSLLAKFQLAKILKNENIDIAVMLNPSKEFNIISRMANIPVRVGYDRKWGFLLTHKIKDNKYLGYQHEVAYNLGLVSLIGAKTEDQTIALSLDLEYIDGLLRDFNLRDTDSLIVIHPWASDPRKLWPENNFLKLAQSVIREFGLKVIIVGSKENLFRSKELFKGLGANSVNLTGKTDLKQLAGLLKKSKLLVSGDSGPVHLASAVGTSVIALFRNDLPGKTAKRWGPWGQNHIVIEKPNLSDIIVDEVSDKIREVLKR